MKNPWLKRNPFMSLWLSGANAIMGAAVNNVRSQVKRQTSAAISGNSKQAARLWTDALTSTGQKKRRR